MSHFAVATMKKMKADNVPGMLHHDFRETDHHKNPDIDTEKSNLNYDLVADHKLHKQDIMDFIDQHRVGKRKVRKDAVVMNEWIISSDHAYFENLSPLQTRQYFETAVDYFGQKFGRNNIQYGCVHLDETTPHMHMGIVPLTADCKLSSKQVFDRNVLRQIQTEFPKYMQEHGFEVVRGSENSERKKLTVPEYKAAKETAKANEQFVNGLKHELVDSMIEIMPSANLNKHLLKDDQAVRDQYERNHLQKILNDVIRIVKAKAKELKNRLKKVEDREKELNEREESLIAREQEVSRKERAFAKFQQRYSSPISGSDPRAYLDQVNIGVVAPVNELIRDLGINNGQKIDPVWTRGLDRGIRR